MSEVKDPLTGNDISFSDAVRRGIIDRDSGKYVSRPSNERLPISDAIQRGLVAARLLEEDDDELATLGADRKNTVVVQKIDRAKKNKLRLAGLGNTLKIPAADSED